MFTVDYAAGYTSFVFAMTLFIEFPRLIFVFYFVQGCQPVVEDWQKIIQVHSLVLEPQEDMQTWLKYASLCRKSKRLVSYYADILTQKNITFHYITLHYITLHYITLHYITLRYFTLHYVTLRYFTLLYVALYYITSYYKAFIYTSAHFEDFKNEQFFMFYSRLYHIRHWLCFLVLIQAKIQTNPFLLHTQRLHSLISNICGKVTKRFAIP